MLVFTVNQLQQVHTTLAEYAAHEIFLLYDQNTIMHCGPLFNRHFPQLNAAQQIILPAGEAYKTIESCKQIWQQMLTGQATTKSLLINIGGGMITDIGGFCAANFKRGIDFINIPTTLLAMVDASIGGKTAVNFGHAKNQIGAFANAKFTFIDPLFLDTLPRPELRSGLAEMVKHELLFNPEAIKSIRAKAHAASWKKEEVILRSMKLKKEVVQQDYYDTGARQALNFGHTIGHAIEALSHAQKKPLLHGEAILLGMIAETKIAEILYDCPREIRRLLNEIKSNFFPMLNARYHLADLLPYLEQDKKNDAEIRFSLLKNVAQPVLQVSVSPKMLADALA